MYVKLCGSIDNGDHITHVLHKLHLSYELIIRYLLLMYTYKAMHNMAPSHLNCLINVGRPVGTIRSSTEILLVVPKIALNRHVKRTLKIGGYIMNGIPLVSI